MITGVLGWLEFQGPVLGTICLALLQSQIGSELVVIKCELRVLIF